MPTSKTTTSSISNLTNPTYNSLIVKSKNSFEFVFDCELVLFLLLLLQILKTIGHDVDEDVKLNFLQQNFIVFKMCFSGPISSHTHLFGTGNTGFALQRPNSISFHFISFQPNTTITAATTTRFICIYTYICMNCFIMCNIYPYITCHTTPYRKTDFECISVLGNARDDLSSKKSIDTNERAN